MNKGKIIFVVGAVLLLIAIQFFIIYPLPEASRAKYFLVKFSEILNIVVLGIVAYLFVEYKNDTRAQKMLILQIIDRAIQRCSDDKMYNINNKDAISYVTYSQRGLINELNLIARSAEKYGYQVEVAYCIKKHGEYWGKISDRMSSFDKLAEVKPFISSDLQLLINKLEEISFKIYDD